MDAEARSASSSPPGARRSRPSRPGCRLRRNRARARASAAKRSRCSPASASTTTPASNAATSAASPTRVLDALARALQLDEAERAHLFDLARAAQPDAPRRRRRPAKQRSGPRVQRILDAMTGAPAFVRNGRLDILAANQLGYALYSELLRQPGAPREHGPVRLPRPPRRDFYSDWDQRRERRRRDPALRSRPRPPRPRAHRPRRRALHPKRRSSAPAGPRTTSATTTPAPSASTIRSSATSTSPTRRCSSPPTPA